MKRKRITLSRLVFEAMDAGAFTEQVVLTIAAKLKTTKDAIWAEIAKATIKAGKTHKPIKKNK